MNITPSTKVHDLLEAHPELEDELIAMAPPFKKLKNPFLRNSVGKVATIKHIASVAGIPLNELVNKIRTVVGKKPTTESYNDENYFTEQPKWFSNNKISLSINEDKLENKNQMTLVTILQDTKNVKKGEIIELITTFLPAPGIDILKSKGYSVWSKKLENGLVKSYFLKNSE
jgi:phage tail sheath protein FI